MTDTANGESLWVDVLAHAEKLLQLVRDTEPKEDYDLPAAHLQVMLEMFWRAVGNYDVVLVTLKCERPKSAVSAALSLFNFSLCLEQLKAEPHNRDALILWWVNDSINQ